MVTQWYDCGTRITRPDQARNCLTANGEHVFVLCLNCRSGPPSKRQYSPTNGLPPRSKVRIPGGESS